MRALITAIILTFFISSAMAAAPVSRPGPQQPDKVAPQGGTAASGDIEQLAFLVLMEAAKSAQEDLKAIMAQVKAINNAKQAQRRNMQQAQKLARGPCETPAALIDCLKKVDNKVAKMKLAALDLMRASVMLTQANAELFFDSLRHAPEEIDRIRKNERPPARIIPPNPCRGWNPSFWKQCAMAMKVELAGSAPDARSQHDLDAALDELIREFNSMSEMSDEMSLKLQMIMDRRSKFMETLSNIMKKISVTANTITQNMK